MPVDAAAMATRSRTGALTVAALAALCATASAVAPTRADAPRPAPLRDVARPPGPDFVLADTAGRPLTPARLAGRPYLMALGFTHCPDVCPDTLQRLAQAMAEAGEAADAVAVLFVSVDPERDTPALLRDYVQAFDPRIVAATGTPAGLARLYRSLDVRVRKVATSSGYSLDHPLQVYMVDAAGMPAGIVRYVDTPAQVAARIRRLAGR